MRVRKFASGIWAGFRGRLQILLLALVLPSSLVTASTFQGQGQAVVVGDNAEAALEIAMAAARSQALAKALDSYATRGDIDPHLLDLRRSKLLAGAGDFVTREAVLSRNFQAPLLRVTVQLEIDSAGLERYLGMQGLTTAQQRAARVRARPSVLVVVAEELNGGRNSLPFSAQLIREKLLAADYVVVDQTAAGRVTKHDQAVQAVFNNDAASARAAGLQFDAGLMISGRAVAQKSGVQGGGMQSFGANIALTATELDSGRVLASATADGSYPHVNAITGSRLALEEAAAEAMEDLLAQLDNAETVLATTLRLTISDLNYAQLAILKQIIERDFPEVISMRTDSFGGDIARLSVELEGSVADFAEGLARKKFSGFRLRVLSQSAAKLDLALVTQR